METKNIFLKGDNKMDEATIKEMLEEVIVYEIETIKRLESGSEEKSKAIKDLDTLYRLRNDENKINWEYDDKYCRREMDITNREKDVEIENAKTMELRKDRYIRICIAGAELIIPLIFYGIWMSKGFRFEESGTFSSFTFRNFLNRIKLNKK